MKRYILHTPFNIYHFKARSWRHPVHNHTYFEIIFILKGSGKHHINGNNYAYKKGDVFLLGPEDFHFFDIANETEFCFVRFNESYTKSHMEDKSWNKNVKPLLYTSSQSRGSIVSDKGEQQKLFSLLSVLEKEYENSHSHYFEIIRDGIMKCMMTALARNLFRQSNSKPVKKQSIEAIMLYVRQHIYDSAKLTVEHLAGIFNYAPEYISIFFKKHTGESLKQYIIKHKIKLIEARLMYSQLPLADIAFEFGYSDESHFCKQFRKYTGTTPSTFRKSVG